MPTVFVYVLFFVSGAAGLVYELVWVRELIFVFGGTTYAITTVLVAFMAGLGLGSYVGGRAARRIARPGRAYGVLEIGIGTYALLVPLLLRIAEPSYRALYPHLENAPWLLSLARFGLSAVVLLVPTTLMGATLPVLVRYVTVRGGALGRSIAHLYGLNTGGAVCGVLAAGFWLLPVFGLSNTTRLAALANGLIGLTALLLLRGAPIQPSTRSPAARAKPAASHNPGRGPTRGRPGLGPARGSSTAVVAKMRPAVSGAQMPLTPGIRGALMAGFGVSGFAAMVYQLTWTRALVMSVGSSTYAFTCILAAFILGLALGSLAVARWVDRWTRPVRVFAVLELAIGLIAVLIVPIHGRIPLVVRGLVTQHHADYATLLAWEFLLIIAVTFLPTFLMGAIFPVVTRALARSADDAAAVTGRAYAVNTVGTVLGSFLAGFVLIRSDVLGVQNSIILASALNGLVGAALLAIQPRDAVVPSVASESSRTTRGPLRRFALPVAGLLAIAASATLAGRWDPRLLTTAPYLNRGIGVDRQMLYYAEGVDMTVAVDAPPGRPDTLTLTVNGKPDATTAPVDLVTQLLLGHVPALLHPAPRAGCVIGLGSGMTLSALARHAEFERLDCVEISAEVIEAAQLFAPYNYDVLQADPRVRMLRADGRNHLLLTDRRYDVIVSEPSNPWLAGVANLFTREFFELGRARLNPDGLLAVWLHGYSMAEQDFRMVARTFGEVYPAISVWELGRSDYLLIGGERPLCVGLARFEERFRMPAVWGDLWRAGLYRPADVLGCYIVAGEPLRRWAAGAPLHTDDNALLEFSAPRHLYAGQATAIQASLGALQRPLDDVLTAPPPARLKREVAGVAAGRLAYVAAAAAEGRRDALGVLRPLLAAFADCPTSLGLESALRMTAQRISRSVPPERRTPELAQLLLEAERAPAPLRAGLRGAGPADLAALLAKVAGEAAAKGDAESAESYREHARRMTKEEPPAAGGRQADQDY